MRKAEILNSESHSGEKRRAQGRLSVDNWRQKGSAKGDGTAAADKGPQAGGVVAPG
jgi:hypothetical protein